MMRILGIDPGLRCTGWGVIAFDGGRLQHIANGAIQPKPTLDDAARLQIIFDGLCEVIPFTNPIRRRLNRSLWQNQLDRRFGLAWRAALASLLAASIGLALAKFRRARSKRLLLALALLIKNKSKIWSRACWRSRHKMPMLLMRWQLQSPPAMRLAQRRQSG